VPTAPSPDVAAVPVDVITAARHPLDDILEADLDNWQASPVDQRTEGAVVRATLADPQHRWLVTAWLQEAGLS